MLGCTIDISRAKAVKPWASSQRISIPLLAAVVTDLLETQLLLEQQRGLAVLS
jgi:hypothetical protein